MRVSIGSLFSPWPVLGAIMVALLHAETARAEIPVSIELVIAVE